MHPWTPKGRGGALRTFVWSTSDAPRAGLHGTPTCPPTWLRCHRSSHHCCPGTATWRSASRLTRSANRRPRSQTGDRSPPSYNLLPCARSSRTRFSDAQCGFKAIRADLARELLPLVEDTGWFFDTELLVLAERAGCASTRCPSTGWTTRPRASTSSADRARRICAASARGRGWAAPVARSRPRARERRGRWRLATTTRSRELLRFAARSVWRQHPRLCCCCLVLRPA